MDTIYVTGHRNPDTDSIVSAMAYAGLQRAMGSSGYVAARLGPVSDETKSILDHFGYEPPVLINNVRTQVSDLDFDTPPIMHSGVTMKAAWEKLQNDPNVRGIPVINTDGTLYGMLSPGDVASYDMRSVDDPSLDERSWWLFPSPSPLFSSTIPTASSSAETSRMWSAGHWI